MCQKCNKTSLSIIGFDKKNLKKVIKGCKKNDENKQKHMPDGVLRTITNVKKLSKVQ